MEFFNQLAFEQQCFRFAADEMKIEVTDGVNQGFEFEVPTHAPGGLEIMADPFAQIARLADINNRPEPVAHQVNTWFVRQGAESFSDVIGDRHATANLQPRARQWQVGWPSCARRPLTIVLVVVLVKGKSCL